MSVRSFHSVFMATAVAGAALGCYLVSLRVASERAALESVESQIVSTQADIRLLQTEVGTRGRLAQLERWNVSALALSAPTAGQILGDKFQLARLVEPEHKAAVEAHTCPGDPVDLWRGIQWLKSSGVSADRLVRMIIAHDEKDVWPGKGFVRILLKCKSRCPKKVEEPEENPEQMQAGIMHDRSAGSRHTLK